MGSDPTVNVVVFRLGSVDGPIPVDTDPRADDAVRKAWWKVILRHRPRAQDVVSVHSDWEPSPEDAGFIKRTFVNAAVSHDFDRPDPDGWPAALERAGRTLADRATEPAPAAPVPVVPGISPRPDPDWPFLSAEQGARIREETRAAVARRGVAVTVRGPLLLADGTDWEFPLDNLARSCHRVPEDRWSAMIDGHAASAAATAASDGRRDESAGRPILRLFAEDSVEREIRYARHVADGLIEVISLDLPDRVRMLNDDDVAATDLTALRATARANLLAEPVEYQRVDHPEGAVLHRMYGESMFVASKALVLPELMRAELGVEPPRDGVLVAVPSRHDLVLHLLVDETAVPGLNALVTYARGEYDESPGALSPYVHWWTGGELVPIVAEFDDVQREIRVVIPPGLGDVLNRLCG